MVCVTLAEFLGEDVLKCGGKDGVRVSYELDGFYTKSNGETRSGELRVDADALKSVFAHKDVELITDDGRVFDLSFSDKELRPATDIAHVDATDDRMISGIHR